MIAWTILQRNIGLRTCIKPKYFIGNCNKHLSTFSIPSIGDGKYDKIPQSVRVKRKIALIAGFTGTGYHGMQFNSPDVPTIEGELRDALYKSGCIIESNYHDISKIKWTRSSRTDTGVHAGCVVVAAKLEVDPESIHPQSGRVLGLTEALNRHLNPQIQVFSATQVVNSFRAQKSCKSRHYEYVLPVNFLKETLMKATNSDEISEEQISTAISNIGKTMKLYEGAHYFANFTRVRGAKIVNVPDSDDKTCPPESIGIPRMVHETHNDYSKQLRCIYDCSLSRERMLNEDVLRIRIIGKSFLLHQIRYMVGAAISVAAGKVDPLLIQLALTKSSTHCIRFALAPAEGLILRNCSFNRITKDTYLFNKDVPKESARSARVLIHRKELNEMNEFLDNVIYPHVLNTWKNFDISKWCSQLQQTNNSRFDGKIKALLDHDQKLVQEIRWKQHQRLEEKRSRSIDIVSYRNFLPRSFATDLSVTFRLPPGSEVAHIQILLVYRMLQGDLNKNSTASELIEYVRNHDIAELERLGKEIAKEYSIISNNSNSYRSNETPKSRNQTQKEVIPPQLRHMSPFARQMMKDGEISMDNF